MFFVLISSVLFVNIVSGLPCDSPLINDLFHVDQTVQLQPNSPLSNSSPSQFSRRISLPPQGATTLVGIIVMLSTSILIFAGWRLWVWRRGIIDGRRAARRKRLSQPFDIIEITMPSSPEAAITRDSFETVSPESTIGSNSPQPTTFSHSHAGAKLSVVHPSLGVTPPPVYAEFPVSALSPRISSRFLSARRVVSPPNLPRILDLVVVQSSFITTLHDELKIHKGEMLRVLQEYEDGWCYVQRVGAEDADKGVVPRICLVDKFPARGRGIHGPQRWNLDKSVNFRARDTLDA